MPLDKLHTLGAIVFTGTSAFSLNQLTERSVNPNLTKVTNMASGRPAPSWVAAMFAEPMISASTTEIARALTNLDPLVGLKVKAATAYADLTAYFTQLENQAARSGASAHFKVATSLALVVPVQLSVQQDQEATLSFEVHCLSTDGFTAPWSCTDSVSLPATPVVDEKFTLGPSTINGTDTKGVVGLTYDFGLKVTKVRTDGFVYPPFACIETQEPKLTIATNYVPNLSTFGITGVAQGGTASDFWLRKILNLSTRVADTEEEHIRIRVNADQALIESGPYSGGNNNLAAGEIVFTPIEGGSSLISIAPAAAIVES